MGILFSKAWKLFWSKDEHKIVIVGLDNAGKTTVLYKLLYNEVASTTPTIGSNVEEIVYKNVRFLMWDVGGQEALRASWSAYYTNAKAVIMVIDSNDKDRIHLAKAELHKMLESDSLKTASLLILANKQDLQSALTAAQISEALSLTSLTDRQWHIQACSALTGFGLFEGLDWIVDRLTS
ncbi:ADP-ribosylation factor-like protein 5A [Basidiobolus ranarum]|uniref:ADP-ribosylation factor-like protein 5A n=1 Tax=Basidiobolus ranarum TaxID=34480 RepID=A0ABR2VNQ8_9FUNG